jgi:hypothetical protein
MDTINLGIFKSVIVTVNISNDDSTAVELCIGDSCYEELVVL